MRATQFEFRFRAFIVIALYLLGFYAPWERYGTSGNSSPTRLWSWLAIEAARSNLLSVGGAYLVVTLIAVALAIAGASLRVWGTAYLGGAVMRNPAMQAGAVLAAGPYRHLRNPLYLGMLLTSFAVAVLMPASGALLFVIAITGFTLRLISGEEGFLTGKLGQTYVDYRSAVPALLPRLRSRLPIPTEKARWGQSLLAELYPVGTAACFAVLAWSYDANLLTRCILICFGLHLIARAIVRPKSAALPA